MDEDAFLFLKDWFHQYVQGFYSDDGQLQFHVRLKEEHTLRVLENAVRIGTWFHCTTEELQLIKIAALLHDIGRFQQYQTYRTFNDNLSVNHAQLGLEILQNSKILACAGLTNQQQEIVKKAVLYHNRRRLPLDERGECLVASRITRDADKLDIFAMLVTHDKDNKIPQTVEFENANIYSVKIIEDILQGSLVAYPDIKTANDLLLFRLSWIYDIYFPYSFSYILKEKYLEKLIEMLPSTEEIRCIYHFLWQYAASHAVAKRDERDSFMKSRLTT
jgi:putative nucleotidyltransferase with HDIG domain